MTTKGWIENHKDVNVLMESDMLKPNLIIKIGNDSGIVERSVPFDILPLDESELVLEDYLCAIYEQLYASLKHKEKETGYENQS